MRVFPVLRVFAIVVVFVAMALMSGCSGSDVDAVGQPENRSSGRLAYTDGDSPAAPAVGDPVEVAPEGDAGSNGDPAASSDPGTPGAELATDSDSIFVPVARPDGIELVFADGALGPARLGSTIGEITEALGPLFEVTAEPSIRDDFPAGYSISRQGEVLFWAIEDDGIITVFMTSSPAVGLESGLRPKLPIADAIEAHGAPTFTLGTRGREFVTFADGVGRSEDSISVLVAVGLFGGPVGVYQSAEDGAETEDFQPEDANIKELWFWAEGAQPASASTT